MVIIYRYDIKNYSNLSKFGSILVIGYNAPHQDTDTGYRIYRDTIRISGYGIRYRIQEFFRKQSFSLHQSGKLLQFLC